MEKPEFKIIRQILFFAVGDTISHTKLSKFFTEHAIQEFIKFNFIK